MSLLEAFLAGGVAVGVPSLPGLTFDIDVDGDGLERFELDTDHQLERCIDGDSTVIDGRDCWKDARIADGFALALTVTMVGARFLGRDPYWEHRHCWESLSNLPDSLCFISDNCRREAAERVCPSHAPILESFFTCVAARCESDCGEPYSAECVDCDAEACPEERASCVDAPPCCEEHSETSILDPA